MTRQALHERGFSVVEVLIVVVLAVAVGFGGWLVWHSHHPKKSTDSTTISAINGPSKNKTIPSTATIVSSTDGKVSITLPNKWHILGDKQIISAGDQSACIDIDDASPCIYQAEFQPKALNPTTDQPWDMTVEKTSWTNSEAAYSLLGELSAQNTIAQSTSPINNYDAFYVKVGSSGYSVGDYVDIHYFIEKDGYLIHFSNREKFNGRTGNPSDTWDNSQYSPAFDGIVKSLKLNV